MKKNYNRTGFTRFEALVVVGVIGLILLAVLPALRKPQRRASQINCINNVKQVVLSSRMWANDHEDRMPAQVPTYEGGAKEFVGVGKAFLQFQVMSNELSTPKILLCTEEKRRTWATNFSNLSDSNISFFAAPDAVLSQPDHWLTGHRNLATNKVALIPSEFAMPPNRALSWTEELHAHKGSLGFADLSVQQLTDAQLDTSATSMLRNWLAATNAPFRLLIP